MLRLGTDCEDYGHSVLTCSGSFGQPRLSLADLTHCVPIFGSTTRASPGDSFLPLMSCDSAGYRQLLSERESGRGRLTLPIAPAVTRKMSKTKTQAKRTSRSAVLSRGRTPGIESFRRWRGCPEECAVSSLAVVAQERFSDAPVAVSTLRRS